MLRTAILALPMLVSLGMVQDSRPDSRPETWPALDPKIIEEAKIHESAADEAMKGRNLKLVAKELLAAAEIYKKGGDTPDVAQAIFDVASGLTQIGDWGDSLKLNELSLRMLRAHFPGDHIGVAGCLNNIGFSLVSMGKNAEALPKFKEALAIDRRLLHGNDQELAYAMVSVAACLFSLGKGDEALPTFEEALAMRKRLFEGDHPDVADSLDTIAACLQSLGKSASALPNYEEALAMQRRLSKGDHPLVAKYINDVGHCLQSLGKGTEALQKHEESLAMQRRIFKGDNSDLAQSLNNVATCLQSLGRDADALPKLEEVLAMRRRIFPADHPEIARSLSNLGSCSRSLGNCDDALRNFEAALAMSMRLSSADSPDKAKYINNVAFCLQFIGKSAEALAKYEDAYAMCRRVYKGDHPDIANYLDNVGYCLQSLGNSVDALPKFEEAFDMYRRLYKGDHPDVASSLTSVAGCLELLGKGEDALALFVESLAMRKRIYKGDHPAVANGLNNVAGCSESLERSVEALPLFEEALAMFRRLYQVDHRDLANSIHNVAFCLNSLGKRAEAIPRFEEAIAMQNRLFKGDHPSLANSLNNFARCLESLGRRADALINYRAAIAMAHRLHNKDEYLWSTNYAKCLLNSEGGVDEALAMLIPSFEIMESLVGGASNLDARDRMQYSRRVERYGTAEALSRAQFIKKNYLDQYMYLERSRARTSLDSISTQGKDAFALARTVAAARGDAALALEIDQISTNLSGLNANIIEKERQIEKLRQNKDNSDDGREKQARALDDEAGALHREYHDALARRAQIIRANVILAAAAKPDAIQEVLRENEAILAYSVNRTEAYCILVPPKGGQIRGAELRWKDGSKVIDSDLMSWTLDYLDGLKMVVERDVRGGNLKNVSVASPARRAKAPIPAKITDRGAALFDALVPAEFWSEVKKCTTVYIVPDGAIYWLPFESLITKAGNKLSESEFWLDSGPSVAYVPSGSVLKVLKNRVDARGPAGREFDVVALGDPILPARSTESKPASAEHRSTRDLIYHLDPLPGSRREVDAIERALGGAGKVKTLLGAHATKAEITQLAPRARAIHFATHHIPYQTDRVNLSALILSPADDGSDEGLLTMRDLLDSWRGSLSNCDLVVLAGCGTSLGEYINNEGMYAMPMGFFFAGAPTVVASLWPVADQSTADLMADFYQHWLSPKSGGAAPTKLEALTAARKALKKIHPEPYYWAPFIMMGDPR
ncbi:MAG: CHAT domain-containing protein [Planctomycetes bacterium]|nr:CHAT domain-containing protein [Planctomycetota bacterium]